MAQKRMGPAPFASFEDLSDEVRHAVESPTGGVVRLPDILEESVSVACKAGSCLQTPSTPRIDISRASSSSHHEEDSRDSTPERELFEPTARLGLAFREDGAMELRSSTEELDFQEAGSEPPPAETRSSSCRAASEASHARKDSQGSELAFLSVSGRTSRLSSVGSQGSRTSNQSGLSRSPSPHKMLLETSFCGNKADATAAANPQPNAAFEHALLARKHDPTQAVLAEGISIEMRKKIQPVSAAAASSPKRRPAAIPIVVETENAVTQVVQHPMSPGKTIVAESGVEYTFIPLKGPLPPQLGNRPGGGPGVGRNKAPPPPARRSHATAAGKKAVPAGEKCERTAPPASKRSDSPEYIRIKLKPDHMYTESESTAGRTQAELHKPVTLNLNNGRAAPAAAAVAAPTSSPKLPRMRDSRTPSPSVSRKSSFTSLFRSKEAIISSPESPGEHRARSKSKEREHKSSVFGIFKSKRSCVKKQSSPEPAPVSSPLPSLEFTFNSRPQVQARPPERLRYYETPLEGDSIRIPLHSPGSEPPPLDLAGSPPPVPPPAPPPPHNQRHSTTSSDNIVFSTQLGSSNEIFTTKLPKEKGEITENHCERPVERRPSSGERVSPPPPPPDLPAPAPAAPACEPCTVVRSESSESEREVSEAGLRRRGTSEEAAVSLGAEDEHELRTLVLEPEWLEESEEEEEGEDGRRRGSGVGDELPYVPTTLPLERSVAVPIVPVKQRGEIKMCGIERPRSTTPINPSCLEEYCEEGVPPAEPKLRISLPREETERARSKSPRKWTDFAERHMAPGAAPNAAPGPSSPPPLPPRAQHRDWINFEEVPERRKPPKRIQVVPQTAARPEDNVIYSYVNPEDCKCECHELAPRANPQPTPDAFPHHKLSS